MDWITLSKITLMAFLQIFEERNLLLLMMNRISYFFSPSYVICFAKTLLTTLEAERLFFFLNSY